MKRFLLLAVILFMTCQNCFAANGINFIYLNGSNDNDLKMKRWFENGVRKLHPVLKHDFENDKLAKEHFFKNDKYHIESKPIIFYWGDRSKQELSFLDNNIAILKGVSPWVAYQVRKYVAHCLHDAIWVEKYHNMKPILDNLHDTVMKQYEKGNSVVLYGYSAGSFITYEYLLNKLPYINMKDFLNKIDASQEMKDFVAQNPTKDTCIDGIANSRLATMSMSGHVIPTPDKEAFKYNYINYLNNMTDKYCAPEGSINGVINFASPLVLFYSDISDPNFELTYYNRLMFKYIIEKNLFWLTVNYKDDPLGFPVTRNLTIEEIEEYTNTTINPKLGFMYDWSGTGSKRTFVGAHTSYWSTESTLSKAIVKAYDNGYRHQYDKEYQKKAIKQSRIKVPVKITK